MPNGVERDWVRLCGAVHGFYSRYRKWPTHLRVYEGNLQKLFTPESWAIVNEKIAFVYDGSTHIADDLQGNSYNYGQEGFAEGFDLDFVQDWFGVQPDSDYFLESPW